MMAIASVRAKIAKDFYKPIASKISIEKVKKIAMPILIVVGILMADIGAAFLDASFPVFGVAIIASAVSLIALAIFKIKASWAPDSQKRTSVDLEKKDVSRI